MIRYQYVIGQGETANRKPIDNLPLKRVAALDFLLGHFECVTLTEGHGICNPKESMRMEPVWVIDARGLVSGEVARELGLKLRDVFEQQSIMFTVDEPIVHFL